MGLTAVVCAFFHFLVGYKIFRSACLVAKFSS